MARSTKFATERPRSLGRWRAEGLLHLGDFGRRRDVVDLLGRLALLAAAVLYLFAHPVYVAHDLRRGLAGVGAHVVREHRRLAGA
jgi:hypothetical protein